MFLAIALILISALLSTLILANHHSNDLLFNKSIVIDPGHGGIDGGTNDGSAFLEKNINLQIALKLRQILITHRAAVDMTRETDISLDDRNSGSASRHARDLIARVEHINNGKYDVFVSIHVNSSRNSNAIGPMVLYSDNVPSATLLATCIQERLNEHARNVLNATKLHSPLLTQFFILKNANIPGVLIETGFISNSTEKKLLTEDSYQTKIANAVCNGIKDYFAKVNEVNSSKPVNPLDKNKIIPSYFDNIQLVKK